MLLEVNSLTEMGTLYIREENSPNTKSFNLVLREYNMQFSNLNGFKSAPSLTKQRDRLSSNKFAVDKETGEKVSTLRAIKTKTTFLPQRTMLLFLLLGSDMRQTHAKYAHRRPPKTRHKTPVERNAYFYFNETDNNCRLTATTGKSKAFDDFTKDIPRLCQTISASSATQHNETLPAVFRNLYLNSVLFCEKETNFTKSIYCLNHVSNEYIDYSRRFEGTDKPRAPTNLQTTISFFVGSAAFIAITCGLAYFFLDFHKPSEESQVPSTNDEDTVATVETDLSDLEAQATSGVELTERTQPLSESTHPSNSRNINS